MNAIVTILYFGISLATFAPVVLSWTRRRPREPNRRGRASGTITTLVLYVAFFTGWTWCGLGLAFGLAVNHIYGMACFATGASLRIAALCSLRDAYCGRIAPPTHDALATTGVYAVMRHPLHAGLILELAGVGIMAPSVTTAACIVLTLAVVFWRNSREDRMLREHMGMVAIEYQRRVPAMNPAVGVLRLLRSRKTNTRVGFPHVNLVGERIGGHAAP